MEEKWELPAKILLDQETKNKKIDSWKLPSNKSAPRQVPGWKLSEQLKLKTHQFLVNGAFLPKVDVACTERPHRGLKNSTVSFRSSIGFTVEFALTWITRIWCSWDLSVYLCFASVVFIFLSFLNAPGHFTLY